MQALCRIKDIPSGTGREIEADTPQGRRLIAVFNLQDRIFAYLNSCPHQGRSLAFAPDEFLLDGEQTLVCPHHGASFDITSGTCNAGPCKGDSLTAVAISVQNGTLYLEQ